MEANCEFLWPLDQKVEGTKGQPAPGSTIQVRMDQQRSCFEFYFV